MKKITIAIDWWAGTGKGTTAKWVADALWYQYVDTGAMYRAVVLYLIQYDIPLDDESRISDQFADIHITFQDDIHWPNQTYLNGTNVETETRQIKVSSHVAQVAAFEGVRNFLISQQKLLAKDGWVVMDGRDMGTVVVPDAQLKIHIIADLDVRASRRQAQLAIKGEIHDLASIQETLRMRDEIDYTWDTPTSWISPDAIELDTSHTTIQEQIEFVVSRARDVIKS